MFFVFVNALFNVFTIVLLDELNFLPSALVRQSVIKIECFDYADSQVEKSDLELLLLFLFRVSKYLIIRPYSRLYSSDAAGGSITSSHHKQEIVALWTK